MNSRRLIVAPEAQVLSIVSAKTLTMEGAIATLSAWIISGHFAPPRLFDQFVGASNQVERHGDRERFRGFEIDHQFEFGGLEDR